MANSVICVWRLRSLLVAGLLGILAGCHTSNPASLPSPVVLRFESAGSGVFESYAPASLEATPQADLYQFAVSAGNTGGQWSMTTSLSLDLVTAGRGELPISSGGDGRGSARMDILGVAPEGGTLNFEFQKGSITGTVSTSPQMFSGTFSGKFRVSCMVPAELLPGQRSEAGGTNVPGAMVEDKNLETEACAVLRQWRGP